MKTKKRTYQPLPKLPLKIDLSTLESVAENLELQQANRERIEAIKMRNWA